MSVDSQVIGFLQSLDKEVLDKTIVILFSEHGEMFAKHGRFGRAGTTRGSLYDDVARVPLIIKIPGRSGARISGLVQLIDIMPTVLDLVGVPKPASLQGRSLLPLIVSSTPVNEYAYAGALYNVGQKGLAHPFFSDPSLCEFIRNTKWKLIHEVIFYVDAPREPTREKKSETYELYDLKSDPEEKANIIDSYPGIAKDLKEKLGRWSDKTQQAFKDKPPETVKFPIDFVEKAQKHGYW